jgi:hypothetical protein
MEQTVIPFHPADCGWHRDRHSCGCGLFNTLFYVEPGEGDSTVTHYLSVEEAIIRQVAHAASENHIYSSQDEALNDFIALHWAWFKED